MSKETFIIVKDEMPFMFKVDGKISSFDTYPIVYSSRKCAEKDAERHGGKVVEVDIKHWLLTLK